jgi:hypothetical protein
VATILAFRFIVTLRLTYIMDKKHDLVPIVMEKARIFPGFLFFSL